MPTTATQQEIDPIAAEIGARFQAWAVYAGEKKPEPKLDEFAKYQLEPQAYIEDKLLYSPWAGVDGASGQAEIIEHYALVLKQLHERQDYEAGVKSEGELKYWTPGSTIQNWISVDAGHNVGKTTAGAFIINHFFDCFPSIGYCFAPSFEQINDLLFKEIRVQRRGKQLPGEVLEGEPRIKLSDARFVKGKATNNAKNTGTERAQGQHGEYLIFVLDEAEAIQGYIFDAVRSMSSGGIAIVVILRNPRTTICEAHKIRRQPNVKSFRISCLDHPNVIFNKEIIPGSVRREYVVGMLDSCEKVEAHNDDDYTFTLPWDKGQIYRPSLEFLWRVLGIASAKGTDDTFCPPGRYEAAITREPYDGDDIAFASVGIDGARYGNDKGTMYVRHAGRVYKAAEISGEDGFTYYLKAKEICVGLHAKGVKRIQVRADGGGGYCSTCVDNLNRDADLKELLESISIIEVHNNGVASDPKKYSNKVTELYAYAGEALKVLRLDSPSLTLEVDLCERKYHHVIKTVDGKTRLDVKELYSKEKFRDDYHRSPDDGDGFVLAVAGEGLFKESGWSEWA